MRLTAFVLALLGTTPVLGAQGVQSPPDAGTPLMFEVTVRQYGPNNRPAASAGNSGTSGRFESYVWTSGSLCGMSASSTEPTVVPTVGWHFTGDVLSSSGGQMSVRVDWQRLWDKGARVDGPKGTQQITLRNGERLELDRVLPAGQSPCGAVDAKLEAAVVATPAYRLTTVFAAAGGRGGGGRASAVGGGGGSGVATGVSSAGSGTGTGVGATGATAAPGRGGRGGGGSATTVTAGGRGSGGGGGGRGGVATGTGVGVGGGATTTVTAAGRGGDGGRASTGDRVSLTTQAQTNLDRARFQNVVATRTLGSYEAELWLVHRRPDGPETVQTQSIRFGGSVAEYRFPPIQVSTSRGVITLDITGKLQTFLGEPPDPNQPNRLVIYRNFQFGPDPQQAPRVMLSISRRARAAGAPLLDITGGSSMAIDMPSATDVLSFEFPALQKATEDLLKGHQFSLRVRVTQVAR